MRRPIALVVVGLVSVLCPRPASAQSKSDARAISLIDRVVAFVDDVSIFRSDITTRARPFLEKLSHDPVVRRTELEDLHRQLLEKSIDDVLIGRDAKRRGIEVSAAEVAAGIKRVAEQNGVGLDALYAELKRAGLTRAEYEDEIRKQIIEGKWMTALVVGRIDRKQIADENAWMQAIDKERRLLLTELRRRAYIEVRW